MLIDLFCGTVVATVKLIWIPVTQTPSLSVSPFFHFFTKYQQSLIFALSLKMEKMIINEKKNHSFVQSFGYMHDATCCNFWNHYCLVMGCRPISSVTYVINFGSFFNEFCFPQEIEDLYSDMKVVLQNGDSLQGVLAQKLTVI